MTNMSFPKLEAKQAELQQIFAEAGPEYDLSRVKSISGSDHDKVAYVRELNDEIEELQRVGDVAQKALSGGHTEAGAEQGGGPRAVGVSDSARRTIDALHKNRQVPDHAAERAEALLKQGSPAEQSLAARWATATGDPHYLTAFAKLAGDPQRGHLLWSPREQAAYKAVEGVGRELKAMAVGTDTAGGFLAPFVLDPSIMLTSAGSVDPLRSIARVVQTVSTSWNGVTSAGVTAEWKAEGVEAADASPTVAQPSIPVHFGDAFVPFSYEVEQDAVDLVGELQPLLMDAAAQLQAAAYWNGTGTGQPTGLTVGLAAGSKVATATADTIVAADVFGLQAALPPRFQGNAQWASNLETAGQIQQMETTNGSKTFPEIADSPPRLLRKLWNEASQLDTAGDTSTAGNDNVVVYGDFRAGFVIVDRIGTRIDIVQNLFGANQRPTGERGFFMTFRTGSDVVNDSALRLLTA